MGIEKLVSDSKFEMAEKINELIKYVNTLSDMHDQCEPDHEHDAVNGESEDDLTAAYMAGVERGKDIKPKDKPVDFDAELDKVYDKTNVDKPSEGLEDVLWKHIPANYDGTSAEIGKEIDKIAIAVKKWVEGRIDGKVKRHKKNGGDCGDCGLFNVVKGEVCDCEYNEALNSVRKALLGEDK